MPLPSSCVSSSLSEALFPRATGQVAAQIQPLVSFPLQQFQKTVLIFPKILAFIINTINQLHIFFLHKAFEVLIIIITLFRPGKRVGQYLLIIIYLLITAKHINSQNLSLNEVLLGITY